LHRLRSIGGGDSSWRRRCGQTPRTAARKDYAAPALGGVTGQASDIKIQAEEILKSKRVISEILAKHTGQPIEKIIAETERDRYMTADQAKEYGLIDEVLHETTDEKDKRKNK
jgi:ATP-dependent Clp endopeptidase proteolytic subunit ClpP